MTKQTKFASIFSVIVLIAALSVLTPICDAQVKSKKSEPATNRPLTAAEKRELNFVFPIRTRKYLLVAKSLIVSDSQTRRTIELSDTVKKKELLDSIFFDAALARKVEDTCNTPEYSIATAKGGSAWVMFSIAFACNDITGGDSNGYLIQGRIDGNNSRSKQILVNLFEKK